MTENPPSVEETLSKIAAELRTDPEVLRIVDELGIEQVQRNVLAGIERMRIAREERDRSPPYRGIADTARPTE